MATRPVFIPVETGDQLFEVRQFSFHWHSGFAESQKRKNIVALHEAARRDGLQIILEVSTKSDLEIGRRLSAFSLKYHLNDKVVPLECVYQGSKVFADGGPYVDMYDMTARECKSDERLRSSGPIRFFIMDGIRYDSKPFNAFYDWIYIRSLIDHEDYILEKLANVDGFTDIEFNPDRSLNCQARSIAILIALAKRQRLKAAAADFQFFCTQISGSFSAL